MMFNFNMHLGWLIIPEFICKDRFHGSAHRWWILVEVLSYISQCDSHVVRGYIFDDLLRFKPGSGFKDKFFSTQDVCGLDSLSALICILNRNYKTF